MQIEPSEHLKELCADHERLKNAILIFKESSEELKGLIMEMRKKYPKLINDKTIVSIPLRIFQQGRHTMHFLHLAATEEMRRLRGATSKP